MARTDKLDSLLQKEISNIIQFDLNNPEIGFVTVSEVRVSPDLSKGKVYVSFFGKNYEVAALKKSKGFIKTELAKRIKLRKIPDLEFVVDDTLQKVSRIEEIVNHSKS